MLFYPESQLIFMENPSFWGRHIELSELPLNRLKEQLFMPPDPNFKLLKKVKLFEIQHGTGRKIPKISCFFHFIALY